MHQDIADLLTPSCELLALGEPTHGEPVFARLRNDLLAELAGRGFRSVVLETDRVSALAVDDHVRGGTGDLDAVPGGGFTHGFGAWEDNRRLVAWMRRHNEGRPPEERLAFHGCDAPTENTTAPSPRRYLEHARDYLHRDDDIAALTGDDDRWERTEAILDPARSPGATADADRLRLLADDLHAALYAGAPELVAATSLDRWFRARTHLTAGIGLLRYHARAAEPGPQDVRIARLLGSRDVLMARNLTEIREIEAPRGPTLVFAHNAHLRRGRNGGGDTAWSGAGGIVGAVLGDRYVVLAGSLGRSDALGVPEPEPDSYEGTLQRRFPDWGLARAADVVGARTRTTPFHGYVPLDRDLLDAVDGVLHANG